MTLISVKVWFLVKSERVTHGFQKKKKKKRKEKEKLDISIEWLFYKWVSQELFMYLVIYVKYIWFCFSHIYYAFDNQAVYDAQFTSTHSLHD